MLRCFLRMLGRWQLPVSVLALPRLACPGCVQDSRRYMHGRAPSYPTDKGGRRDALGILLRWAAGCFCFSNTPARAASLLTSIPGVTLNSVSSSCIVLHAKEQPLQLCGSACCSAASRGFYFIFTTASWRFFGLASLQQKSTALL